MLTLELLPSPAVCILIALPLLCCCLPIRWALRQEWPTLRQSLYFPVVGQVRFEHRRQRARLLRRIGGIETTVVTADNRKVHCVWAPSDDDAANGPVVLLLHANAMVLDDMVDWALYYMQFNVSVMMVTFWGYPDPTEDFEMPPDGSPDSSPQASYCPSESTIYLDAEAALAYVQQVHRVPNDRILAHGLSLGGAAASALGVHHQGLKVTVDQTFASIYDVSVHVGRSLYDQLIMPRVPRWARKLAVVASPCVLRVAASLIVRMLFKIGDDPNCCTQDRLDNVSKAKAIRGDYFVFYSEHDEMMPTSFARRLVAARYGSGGVQDLARTRILCVPGGHCAFFADVPELAEQYRKYLHQIGFLS